MTRMKYGDARPVEAVATKGSGMEIGGFEWSPGFRLTEGELQLLVDAVRVEWPEACVEAEGDEHEHSYIYASPEARELWEEEGWTPRGSNLLVTLFSIAAETWFVVGAPEAPILRVIQEAAARIQLTRNPSGP